MFWGQITNCSFILFSLNESLNECINTLTVVFLITFTGRKELFIDVSMLLTVRQIPFSLKIS